MAAPNLAEIENGIYELEHEESSKYGYILLAALHTCRNEMLGLSSPAAPQVSAYSEAAAPIEESLDQYGDSEFLQAVTGKDPALVWPIIDAHMETLRVVNPRAYENVMSKLELV